MRIIVVSASWDYIKNTFNKTCKALRVNTWKDKMLAVIIIVIDVEYFLDVAHVESMVWGQKKREQ